MLVEHAARAERYVFDDPVGALTRLRQFCEALAQNAAAYAGSYTRDDESLHGLLRRLERQGVINRQTATLFHTIRKTGNDAVHGGHGTQREAFQLLKLAWRLALWFHRAFKDSEYRTRPFVAPPDPREAEKALREELAALRAAQAEQQAALETARATAEEESILRRAAEAEAARQAAEAEAAYENQKIALELAAETEAQIEAQKAAYDARLDALQAQAAAQPQQVAAIIHRAQTIQPDLDEADTRLLVDAQLRAAGWEADTQLLRYSNDARPEKGRNQAIAEWPTVLFDKHGKAKRGRADYVLFVGLQPVGVIEAKRSAKTVAASIRQSKRYAKGYIYCGSEPEPARTWGEYKVPFLFATNGRAFLRQLAEQSGIWFLDARRKTNHPRVIEDWYRPESLLDLLKQDHAKADAALQAQTPDYLPLRAYQIAAINAVEQGIIDGRQDMLLAMATGCGKTRTAICLIYRLIKAKRFRRVLFMVDRTALGLQAHDAFKDLRLEGQQAFPEIYDVKGLGDLPESDTRLHIATVQSLVRRVLYPAEGEQPVPVDQYDCVVVDEAHRGYTLDREMSDGELMYRNEADYISTYRRVLDRFDAVRIGLTATPALHTSEIFGPPIYRYGYRRAVIEGYLVDHEPPIRIRTTRNQEGITWAAGEQVTAYDTGTGELVSYTTPDQIDIDVDGFNRSVITEPFNRAVCDYLAQEIDPDLPGKTLIFCATDVHCDMVVRLLKAAYDEHHGGIEDDAIVKITGAADQPGQLIRRYKNERLPQIAVTVDLLTTGIDVPKIVNLVFLRRVRSRILYEQMVGRATRKCDAIDKEVFRIFDAVEMYSVLADVTEMKPVAKRPQVSFQQIAQELTTIDDAVFQREVIDQLAAKFQAKRRLIEGEALERFVTLTGGEPEDLVALIATEQVEQVVHFFESSPGVARFLDELKPQARQVLVSAHDDAVIGIERGYGTGSKPEDYLESFEAFIKENQNLIPALTVVTQRPRELSRKELRELRLQLDQAGFPVTALRTAWHETRNEDVAASIIGFIRQMAIGEPLVPYAERVDAAMKRVLSSRQWTTPQRKWLGRIAKQLKVETIVDREALDQGSFKDAGGFDRLDRIFGGELGAVLDEIRGAIWGGAA